MFCTKCGAQNSDRANYCQRCGNLLETEEETRIARPAKTEKRVAEAAATNDARVFDDERQIFSISPTMKFVRVGYAAAAFGALLLAAFLGFVSNLAQISISAWYSVFLGLALLLIPAFYHLKQRAVRYTLTDAKIEIDTGLISKTTRNVPLRSIQDVTVAATVPQRMLGFGDLIVDNASEAGGKIVLKNIDAPRKYADVLLKQMRRLNK